MKVSRLRKLPVLLKRRMRPRAMELVKWFGVDRVLPDLLIIGAMKSGTTTLFQMLSEHPGFMPPSTKEIQFFNNPRNFDRGPAWYRAHFPSRRKMLRRSEQLGYRAATGEATPSMHIPMYAENAARIVPNARLVVSLRDPVERAWSHYQHMRRHFRPERNGFAGAIEQDLEWYRQGLELTTENHARLAPKLVNRNYVQRGHYADQIEHWLRFFPRRQFLFLNFDAWKRAPGETVNDIARFTGLPVHDFRERRANAGGYAGAMPESCRQLLVEHYRPHNRRLFELLGEDWGWPR